MDCGIFLKVQDASHSVGKTAYYSVQWSPLTLADRWTIVSHVPRRGGVYEIYWMDEQKALRLFALGNCVYGGLRAELRRLTDPEINSAQSAILTERKIWYRYAISDSAAAMTDVLWFFRSLYFPGNPGVEHSGLYKRIFLQEFSPNNLSWIE
jgi:hypothetical protein